MGKLQDDEEYIEPFSKRLERVIDKRDFTQTELARISELPISYITDMKQGDRTRITPTPVLKCIEGLIRLKEITTRDEVNDWLFSFADETGRKYIPVEELGGRGEEILILLPKPKYYTRDTELIGRDKVIDEISTILLKGQTRLLTLVGLPGVGKTELARQIAKLPLIRLCWRMTL